MHKRGKKETLIRLAIAAALVLVLLTAGTVLRMRTAGLGFTEALRSFIGDSFGALR